MDPVVLLEILPNVGDVFCGVHMLPGDLVLSILVVLRVFGPVLCEGESRTPVLVLVLALIYFVLLLIGVLVPRAGHSPAPRDYGLAVPFPDVIEGVSTLAGEQFPVIVVSLYMFVVLLLESLVFVEQLPDLPVQEFVFSIVLFDEVLHVGSPLAFGSQFYLAG